MGIIDQLKYRWTTGSMLVKLIFINIAVFIILHLITLILLLAGISADTVLAEVELPSRIDSMLTRPWTLFTYMFAQYDLFHILFNMLWLYWFGVIFLLADTSKRMLALYIYCGLGGALLFMAYYNVMDMYGLLIGSSASVIGIVTATAIRHPDYKMGIMFIGEISLKWLAVITIAIDMFSIGGSNAGGHVAHIGGAITGALYAVSQKKGVDITRPFSACVDGCVNIWRRITTPRKKSAERNPSAGQAKHATGKDMESSLDEILDKVKKSGYGALTKEEKQRLFDISKRIK